MNKRTICKAVLAGLFVGVASIASAQQVYQAQELISTATYTGFDSSVGTATLMNYGNTDVYWSSTGNGFLLHWLESDPVFPEESVYSLVNFAAGDITVFNPAEDIRSVNQVEILIHTGKDEGTITLTDVRLVFEGKVVFNQDIVPDSNNYTQVLSGYEIGEEGFSLTATIQRQGNFSSESFVRVSLVSNNNAFNRDLRGSRKR